MVIYLNICLYTQFPRVVVRNYTDKCIVYLCIIVKSSISFMQKHCSF